MKTQRISGASKLALLTAAVIPLALGTAGCSTHYAEKQIYTPIGLLIDVKENFGRTPEDTKLEKEKYQD